MPRTLLKLALTTFLALAALVGGPAYARKPKNEFPPEKFKESEQHFSVGPNYEFAMRANVQGRTMLLFRTGEYKLATMFWVDTPDGEVKWLNGYDIASYVRAKPMLFTMRDGTTIAASKWRIYVCWVGKDSCYRGSAGLGGASLYAVWEDTLPTIDVARWMSAPLLEDGTQFYNAESIEFGIGERRDAMLQPLIDANKRIAAYHEGVRTARQQKEASREEARARAIAAREAEAAAMRKSIKIGTHTNCGVVFEVRKPMIGVQTPAGMQFIELDRLYAPGAGCAMNGQQYVGPTGL